MAPKKRAVKAVITAKKVVEETVEVVVSPPEGNDKVEILSSSTKENKNLEILTVPVQKKSQRQKRKEPETAPAPPEDEDETQPSSEAETAPTPPAKEAPPPKSTGVAAKKRATGNEKGGDQKRRKRIGGVEGYKRYVYKVMKQVHPDLGISSMAMAIINNLMSDMFEKIAEEAARLQKYAGRVTLSSREVQGAVKLVLPGELGKHAVAEGTKAVGNYVSYPAAGNTGYK